jgi:hypothetical protein
MYTNVYETKYIPMYTKPINVYQCIQQQQQNTKLSMNAEIPQQKSHYPSYPCSIVPKNEAIRAR